MVWLIIEDLDSDSESYVLYSLLAVPSWNIMLTTVERSSIPIVTFVQISFAPSVISQELVYYTLQNL